MHDSDLATPPPLLAHRRSMTDEFGVETLDQAFAKFRCTRCRAPVPDPTFRSFGDAPYLDLEGLGAVAARLARAVGEAPAPECPGCGAPARLARLEVHSYDASAGRDLVLAVGLDGRAPVLSWWHPETGLGPAEPLSEEQRTGLAASWLARCLAFPFGHDVGELVDALADLVASAPAHPGVVQLVPALIGLQEFDLATEVARARAVAAPDEPWAHLWLGEILLQQMNRGERPFSELPRARRHLETARRLGPDLVEARLSLALCQRLERDENGARRTYEEVLRSHPDCAIAHCNLGLMRLAKDPAAALAHFEAAEAIDEDDADHPMGCARALVALGRKREARKALERARRIHPDHPRLAEVAGAL